VPDFFLGLSLAPPSAPTGLAVLSRSPALDAAGAPRLDHNGDALGRYALVHLERAAAGTPYPDVVKFVADLLARPGALHDACPAPLAVDATAVGRPVVDLVLDARLPAGVTPVSLTAGGAPARDVWRGGRGFASVPSYRVPKPDLIAAVQACLQSGRLAVAKGLDHGETLRKELLGFRPEASLAPDPDAPAWRDDEQSDLVWAVALALWLGERTEAPEYRFL
jgi:hypothetical protein